MSSEAKTNFQAFLEFLAENMLPLLLLLLLFGGGLLAGVVEIIRALKGCS